MFILLDYGQISRSQCICKLSVFYVVFKADVNIFFLICNGVSLSCSKQMVEKNLIAL